ncbi:hypothetical protein GCM10022631_29870 [Deinococcus rubellus]|uniref:TniQ family protein n=1 Tax=Deinococcus rubellus TaxID=1889240 RepID=UPI0031EE9E4F
MSVPPLPLYPAPLDDEWIGSWVARIARANLLPMPKLLEHFGIDAVPRLSAASLAILSAASGVVVDQLAPLQTPQHPLLDIGVYGTKTTSCVLGVRFVQVCPACLASDPVPFIRVDWVTRSVADCPHHGGPLRVQCPHCNRHIQVSKPQGADVRIPVAAMKGVPTHLGHCLWCGGELSDSPDPHLKVIPPLPGSQRLTKVAVPNELWGPFGFALWLTINHFRVTESVRPGFLEFLTTTSSVYSTHPSQARFAASELASWLLSESRDDFLRRHGRIRAFAAGAMIPHLNVKPTSSRRRLYLTWLLNRLLLDEPKLYLSSWPDLVRYLVARLESGQALPKQLSAPFELTPDQWNVMEKIFSSDPRPRTPENVKAILETLFNRVLFESQASIPWPGTMNEQVERWRGSGQLGLAIHLLHQHWRQARGNHQGPLAWAERDDGDDWRVQTARLFLTDSFIEFIRQTNPTLHRDLLLALLNKTINSFS